MSSHEDWEIGEPHSATSGDIGIKESALNVDDLVMISQCSAGKTQSKTLNSE